MGSASRAALRASIGALDDRKSVSLSDGVELLTAARAIAGSSQLRTVLADPAIEGPAKATLISRIFPGLGTSSRAVLAAVVSERWSDGSDLVDGVEEVGIRAVASSEKTKTVEAELFGFARTVAQNADLELALSSKLGDPEAKAALVEALLAKQTSAATLAIAVHLVQSARGRRVGESFRQAADIVASAGDRVVVTVTSAVDLSAPQRKRLGAALQERYGLHPQLNVVVDPRVVGGLRVQIGDDVIDGTIATRLHDLRTRLVG